MFTNGCFDLLHPGHIRSLESGRSLGDLLVVGINSDSSVRELKGPGRPVTGERERGEILAALAAVDFVVIFHESTPRELIAALLPDVLFKGNDWAVTEVIGREEVEAAGGKVVSIPLESGYSTTRILQKIQATASESPMPDTSMPVPSRTKSNTSPSAAPELPASDTIRRSSH